MVRSHARRSGISSVDDLESESVSTDKEKIKSDGSEPEEPSQQKTPFMVRGSSDGIAYYLQNQDDSQINDGGKANFGWISNAGEQITTITAHPYHKHFSIYTRNTPYDGSFFGTKKRLDIGADGDLVDVTWSGINKVTYSAIDAQRIRADGSVIFYEDGNQALSDLKTKDKVILGNGVYDPVTISENGVTVIGSGLEGPVFSGQPGDGITITGNRVTVRDIRVRSDGGAGIVIDGASGCHLENLALESVDEEHIKFVNSAENNSAGTIFRQNGAGAADSVLFDSTTNNNVIQLFKNGSGAFTDNSGSNEVLHST